MKREKVYQINVHLGTTRYPCLLKKLMPKVEREMEVLENQLDVLSNICSAKFVPLHNLQTEMGGMEAAQNVM